VEVPTAVLHAVRLAGEEPPVAVALDEGEWDVSLPGVRYGSCGRGVPTFNRRGEERAPKSCGRSLVLVKRAPRGKEEWPTFRATCPVHKSEVA
jgi:hypothetical protein